ncbi:MAG: efflux RND transporter permease subunit [Deltaproteobacteria bacterium]|nr:efflux RND transporter permease subunit [Deltaproteobacteria bacterium]
MSDSITPEASLMKGPIAWMAKNSVAANLLMLIILVGGALGVSRIKQEVFPAFDLDLVRVTVPYPGASPEEVEQGIVLAVEEAVRGIDGVKRVTSSASEGAGTVAVELLIDADPDRVLADVKSEVDRIRTFPEDAEDPEVAIATNRQRVISVVIAGDQDLQVLQEIAERARQELLQNPDVTQVDVEGVPALEISIEVAREKLEEFGLSLQDIATQIRFASLELPGGGIKTTGGEILVRLSDRRVTGAAFGEMILRSTASGASVRLADVAKITDGYADTDQASFFNGQPAVRITAYRVGDETPQQVSEAVRAFRDELRADVPENVQLAIWNDDSELLAGRIDLLVRNARSGLLLVLLVLALFLNLRLAFWVSLGIPISFLGTFLLMPGLDLTVNMVSLFALIIVLGMVVDDAIIVGEAGFHRMREGKNPLEAAIEGAKEMAVPVSFAILTTIAAFFPLLVIPGLFGKIFGIIPMMVIGVLFFSLVESFLILPAHLGHTTEKAPRWFTPRGIVTMLFNSLAFFVDPVQIRVAAGLEWFIDHVYRPVVKTMIAWRYAGLAWGFASLLFAAGLVASGKVPFSFFPAMEGDVVTATVRFPYGTDVSRAEAAGDLLYSAAVETMGEIADEDDMRGMFLRVGSAPPTRGPGAGGSEVGSHVVSLEVNFVPAEEREFTSESFKNTWAEKTPELVGTDSVTFSSAVGPSAGAAVAIQVAHRDKDVLAAASYEVASALASYGDLTNVENGYSSGKQQLDFRLKEDSATAFGLTTQMVASQIRSAFYGAEALREQRGRNEIKVMVRLPEEQRRSEYDLETLEIRTPVGGFVPLSQVASFERNQAPTTIDREDGRRVVQVSADLAPGVRSPQDVLAAVNTELLPRLEADYPGLDASLAGEQREQSEVFSSLGPNFALAMFVIFSLLAVPLKSYSQPLIIMSAIPFGFVGAIMGHLIMGYEISFVSALGIIALAGVVVNDSLVLIDTSNKYRRNGASAYDAILEAGARRFRPIMLTSLTTFFGLMPMIFETSVQAKFLIPMAISLGFGVIFATFVILLLIPAIFMIFEDVKVLLGADDERAPTPPDQRPQSWTTEALAPVTV